MRFRSFSYFAQFPFFSFVTAIFSSTVLFVPFRRLVYAPDVGNEWYLFVSKVGSTELRLMKGREADVEPPCENRNRYGQAFCRFAFFLGGGSLQYFVVFCTAQVIATVRLLILWTICLIQAGSGSPHSNRLCTYVAFLSIT